ncbi:MAG: 5-oxoprolinase subunit PxpB [Alphaproteobacteria bacterium]
MDRAPGEARVLSCGDTMLVVEFGSSIERALSEHVLALAAGLEKAALAGVVEIVPTFRSLAVHYDPLVTAADILAPQIAAILHSAQSSPRRSRTITLPVCYGGEFGPDLDAVAARTRLSPPEVISRHGASAYHAYMLGFLPGFAYLGDIDPAIRLPRHETPRLAVPGGSVAIAASLTAVYPYESPGGWHVIGRTPVCLFTPLQPMPALITPGDRVRFVPVSPDEYGRLAQLCAEGGYRPIATETVP